MFFPLVSRRPVIGPKYALGVSGAWANPLPQGKYLIAISQNSPKGIEMRLVHSPTQSLLEGRYMGHSASQGYPSNSKFSWIFGKALWRGLPISCMVEGKRLACVANTQVLWRSRGLLLFWISWVLIDVSYAVFCFLPFLINLIIKSSVVCNTMSLRSKQLTNYSKRS